MVDRGDKIDRIRTVLRNTEAKRRVYLPIDPGIRREPQSFGSAKTH